jgi:serpin B
MVKTTDRNIDADIVKGNNDFGLNLYAAIRGRSGNLFLSPYSIFSALAMVYAGARSATAEQMSSALHLPVDQARVHAGFVALNQRLRSAGPAESYQLSIANALWGVEGVEFRIDFLNTAQETYGATVRELNFEQNAEGARLTINQWVANETKQKINDLVPAGSIRPDTLLIVTNAIYFNAEWYDPFEEWLTSTADFTVASADSRRDALGFWPGSFKRKRRVSVPFMRQQGSFGYMEDDEFQALELPYVWKEVGMVIMLPRRVEGLPALEQSLTSEKVSAVFSTLGQQRQLVKIELPKFKLTEDVDLGGLLSNRMPVVMSEAADFSGIADRRDIFISGAIHKAYINVDERGTEAAAATGVGVVGAALHPPKPVQFRADHPFLFLIRDRRTNLILFIGRVTNPS